MDAPSPTVNMSSFTLLQTVSSTPSAPTSATSSPQQIFPSDIQYNIQQQQTRSEVFANNKLISIDNGTQQTAAKNFQFPINNDQQTANYLCQQQQHKQLLEQASHNNTMQITTSNSQVLEDTNLAPWQSPSSESPCSFRSSPYSPQQFQQSHFHHLQQQQQPQIQLTFTDGSQTQQPTIYRNQKQQISSSVSADSTFLGSCQHHQTQYPNTTIYTGGDDTVTPMQTAPIAQHQNDYEELLQVKQELARRFNLSNNSEQHLGSPPIGVVTQHHQANSATGSGIRSRVSSYSAGSAYTGSTLKSVTKPTSQTQQQQQQANNQLGPQQQEQQEQQQQDQLSLGDAMSLGINLEQYISKRNERERSRVRFVNDAFHNLQSILPYDASKQSKRMSKVEILRSAMSYIKELETMLHERATSGISSINSTGPNGLATGNTMITNSNNLQQQQHQHSNLYQLAHHHQHHQNHHIHDEHYSQRQHHNHHLHQYQLSHQSHLHTNNHQR